MKLKTKSQPQPEVSAEASLADRIKQAMAEADAFIDLKTAELKASPEGALIPIGVLRQMITKHSRCSCKAALALLEPNQ
jgi:hypothetical protein